MVKGFERWWQLIVLFMVTKIFYLEIFKETIYQAFYQAFVISGGSYLKRISNG
jgi:hypothetical protein